MIKYYKCINSFDIDYDKGGKARIEKDSIWMTREMEEGLIMFAEFLTSDGMRPRCRIGFILKETLDTNFELFD